jgi:dipeptidyl aminopeptidase/acylaminoacyl peptidase
MGVTSSWGNDLDKISPADLADHADAPILLIHGKDDTVVPIEQSETMELALKRAKKPVEFVVMTGEDHFLSREDTRITMLKSAIAFVEKYNPAN